jgi:hypothetical protein
MKAEARPRAFQSPAWPRGNSVWSHMRSSACEERGAGGVTSRREDVINKPRRDAVLQLSRGDPRARATLRTVATRPLRVRLGRALRCRRTPPAHRAGATTPRAPPASPRPRNLRPKIDDAMQHGEPAGGPPPEESAATLPAPRSRATAHTATGGRRYLLNPRGLPSACSPIRSSCMLPRSSTFDECFHLHPLSTESH